MKRPPPISVEKARRILASLVPRPEPARAPLRDALGCVLAEDAASDIDMPPFDKAMMDGYAVVAADTRRVPVDLDVIEEIPAGRAPARRVGPGRASRIMTGAPVPPGADAVVQVEHTEGNVRILRGVRRAQNVARRGEDVRAGQVVLRRGALLRPAELGILAAAGCASPLVYRRVSVAVLVTGDELVPPESKPGPGQIRNSNAHSISAQLRQIGIEAEDLGVARDEEEDLRRKIRAGLERDALILSGGVSAGKWDLVIPVLEGEGVTRAVYQVKIRPGRPFFVGAKGDRRVFALPGNPVSTFVIFEVFVRPFLLRWMGRKDAERPVRRMKLLQPLGDKAERVQYLPARVRGDGVEPLEWHGSADLFALARAQGFVVVPIGKAFKKGAVVDVLMLDA